MTTSSPGSRIAWPGDIDAVNAAVGHQRLLGVFDRDAVRDRASFAASSSREARRRRCGLKVVGLVFVDGAPHRRLDGVRRIEADVALVEPVGIGDRVSDRECTDDAGERAPRRDTQPLIGWQHPLPAVRTRDDR